MLNEELLLLALNDARDADIEETRRRLGYGETAATKVKPRRLGRILLLVALLSTLFVTTAYAAYRLSLASLPAGEYRGYKMASLAGTQESPEGRALRDWLAVLSEHENDGYNYEEAAALGMEYEVYQATNPALAAALDEILDRYGLVKWGVATAPADERAFYEAAGVGRLTRDSAAIANRYLSGYVYPVGSFHLEGQLYPAGENYGVMYQLVRSVKGSFSMAMANLGDAADYTEWEHTTPDGCVLTLAQRRTGGGGIALYETEDSFVFLSFLPETWVDYIGDGRIDGIGDAALRLDFSRADVEAMADAFCWAAFSDPALGMDEPFPTWEDEPTGSLLDLVDRSLALEALPETDQYLISTFYTTEIAPYLDDFQLVDYEADRWGSRGTTGWIAFTGTPKGELNWAAVPTAAGEVYCRSLCLLPGGEEGSLVPGASFDMLPYPALRQYRDSGENGERDEIYLGTALKPLAAAALYVQQLDATYTITDPTALEELGRMLEYGHLAGNNSCRTWNPLYLDFADGTHGVVYTLADGSDGVNLFGEWGGYGYGKTLFELFSVPLEAAGYTHHDGLLTARLESPEELPGGVHPVFEIDFEENGPMRERRVSDVGPVRGRTWDYGEDGRVLRDYWWEGTRENVTSDTRFTYDESGRLLERYTDFLRGWERTSYEYDAQGRLTAEIHTDNDDPPGWTGGNVYYRYDEAGNCRVRRGWQDEEQG